MTQLARHVDFLLRHDSLFLKVWSEMKRDEQDRCRRRWNRIDATSRAHGLALAREHGRLAEAAQRWFTRIQEREFRYSQMPKDWIAAIRNHGIKQSLYERNLTRLAKFVSNFSGVKLYGNIKPEASIEAKLDRAGGRTTVHGGVLELWDVVRFRIVAPRLAILLRLGVAVWEQYFTDVLRCRNYYFRPKPSGPDESYRAIHFELSDPKYGFCEIQLMTINREAVSLLDHSHLFKRTLPFIDSFHERWLREFLMKSNILDMRGEAGPWESRRRLW